MARIRRSLGIGETVVRTAWGLARVLALAVALASLAAPALAFHAPWAMVAKAADTSCGAVCADPLLRQVNIFGPDDRRLMTLTERDWLAPVGTIGYGDNNSLGTATIICAHGGPTSDFDVIVTAAHAFYDIQGRLRGRDFYYYAGGPDGKRVRIISFTAGTHDPYNNFHRDWAVAILERKISQNKGCLRYHSITEDSLEQIKRDGGHYMVAALHSKIKLITVSGYCGPVPKKPGHVGYGNDLFFNVDCDFMKGASGGPMVLAYDDAWYAVAVAVRMVNTMDTKPGDAFDPRFNPNQAVRIAGRFRQTIEDASRTGHCHVRIYWPSRLRSGY